MRYLISLFYLIILVHSLSAQRFYKAEGGVPSLSYVKIDRIELTDSFSIFYMRYEYHGVKERWLCANDRYYLRENNGNEKKRLIRAEDLPMCPERHHFSDGEVLYFRLFFPPLAPDVTVLTFIQGTETESTSSNFNYYFNFYNFRLVPAGREEKTKEVKAVLPKKEPSAIMFNNKPVAVNDSFPLPVLFEHGTDVMIRDTEEALASIYHFLKDNPSVHIELQGHTERNEQGYTRRQQELNQILSEKRVKRVKEYLTTKGISAYRIKAHAYGGTRPVSSDESHNRRVVMKILKL